MKLIDLSGSKFNHLTVVEQVGRDNFGEVMWKCRCDCGNFAIVRSSKLRAGSTISCGCVKAARIGSLNRTHGGGATPEYRSYRAMLRRCYDTKHRAYQWYGARGIKVSERWLNSFPAFVSDMGPRPEGFTLDRLDNDRDYSPDNCRWASWTVQGNNKHKRLPSLPLLSRIQ